MLPSLGGSLAVEEAPSSANLSPPTARAGPLPHQLEICGVREREEPGIWGRAAAAKRTVGIGMGRVWSRRITASNWCCRSADPWWTADHDDGDAPLGTGHGSGWLLPFPEWRLGGGVAVSEWVYFGCAVMVRKHEIAMREHITHHTLLGDEDDGRVWRLQR